MARWSPAELTELLQAHLNRPESTAPEHGELASTEPGRRPGPSTESLDALVQANHSQFINGAFATLLHRAPSSAEHREMLDALLNGASKITLLGWLRYSAEGRSVGVHIPGLRTRYHVHRLLDFPFVGQFIEWLMALARLHSNARYARAVEQRAAESTTDLARRLDTMQRELTTLARHAIEMKHEACALEVYRPPARPALPATLEITSPSLLPTAQSSMGMEGRPIASMSPDERYELFQAAIYSAHLVAKKQRVYAPYLAPVIGSNLPFVDLGCGRGEFLYILRELGIRSLGVDQNPVPLEALENDGFAVVCDDAIEFLAMSQGSYCGASLLQVIEHLSTERVQQLLSVLAERLVPGALIIIETPNPLSPFVLGEFHTDPTHVAPIPPQRLQFDLEMSGFTNVRTLFQAPIPGEHYFGQDARSYYLDYALIATRRAA